MDRSHPDGQQWKPREREILALLAQGLTDREISLRLHLAADTVRWYNKQIFEKLEVRNRTQAVQRAASLGLLTSDAAPPRPEPPSAAPPGGGLPAAARSPIRYVRSGEVSIACMSVGAGPVDLLFIHGFLSHLEVAWEQPEFARFFERLGSAARVILFDKRGVGLSDRHVGAPSIENVIEDAMAVLDAFGSERAFVMGTSEGGAAAVLLAAAHPERISGLVLYGATPKVVRGEDEGLAWGSTPERFANFIAMLQKNWGAALELQGFAPSRAEDPEFSAWWSRILRAAASPASIRAVLENVGAIDITDLLPQVRTRTLVIHKTGDRKVDIAAGRYIAAQMPAAGMLELPGSDHIYFVDSAEIAAAVLRFMRETDPTQPAETWIAVVLCVVTDEDGPPPALIRSEIEPFQPRHFLVEKSALIAVFEGPSRAIRCAQALRDIRKYHSLRIGLHVGECSLAGGRPSRPVLLQALRAAETAAPGEVVVTRTLGDILAGSEHEIVARRTAISDRSRAEAHKAAPLYSLK